MKLLRFTLILGLIGTSGWAASEGGSDRGGGHAYVCFKDAPDRDKVEAAVLKNRKNKSKDDPFTGIDFNSLKIEVLDYSHAVNKYGLDHLIDATGTAEEIAEKQMAILRDKSTFGEELYNLFKKQTRPSLWVKAKNGLSEIDDSNYPLLLQNNCLQMQMAIQDKHDIFYDNRLRGKLDILNDVALVLHETFYRYARKLGHEDSVSVRNFVALMMTKEFASMSGAEIMNEVIQKKLHEKRAGYEAESRESFETLANQNVILAVSRYYIETDFLYVRLVHYDSNSGARGILWNDSVVNNIPLKGRVLGKGRDKNLENFPLYFSIDEDSDKKSLLGGMLAKNISFKKPPFNLPLKGDNIILFYKNGFGEKLKSATLATDFAIDGVLCAGNSAFTLFEDGHLHSCMTVDYDFIYSGLKIKKNTFIKLQKIGERLWISHFTPAENMKFEVEGGWLGTTTKTCVAGFEVELDSQGKLKTCGFKD